MTPKFMHPQRSNDNHIKLDESSERRHATMAGLVGTMAVQPVSEVALYVAPAKQDQMP